MTDADWKKQDPISLFDLWLQEAKRTSAIREPTAMALATTSESSGISNRIVLLKAFSKTGFSFYTNYDSAKGRALAEQAEAAAVFYWDPLARQVRIQGAVKKTSRADSEAYWASRARESQLSQYISRQTEPVADRSTLEKLVKAADLKFKDQPIPCPEHWGGYILEPKQIEFWESRPGRLHERFLFTLARGSWTSQRLYP